MMFLYAELLEQALHLRLTRLQKHRKLLTCLEIRQKLMALEDKANLLFAELRPFSWRKLRDIRSAQVNLSLIRRQHHAGNIQKGAFAAAGGSDNRRKLSFLHGQIDLAQNRPSCPSVFISLLATFAASCSCFSPGFPLK